LFQILFAGADMLAKLFSRLFYRRKPAPANDSNPAVVGR
jgi:hypothetical protein